MTRLQGTTGALGSLVRPHVRQAREGAGGLGDQDDGANSYIEGPAKPPKEMSLAQRKAQMQAL
ncbi:hypothetical protein GCM10018779_58600 [Streptomyces griseocarneus]|nr:hypothetical protein GCM10018779_58600 [Streptomyces griseocarneus]